MLERREDLTLMLAWVLLLAATWMAASAPGQEKPAPPAAAVEAPAELQKIGDGVFVRIVSPDGEEVANSGVVILNSGVLLFDSHFHADHTHGNQAFVTARQIIGGTLTRRDMLQKDVPALNRMQGITQGQVEKLARELRLENDPGRQESLRSQFKTHQAFMRRLASLKILAPSMTLDDSLSIVDGDREVNLLYLGAGHTESDIVLYLPHEKIAFLGDLFFNDALPNVEDAFLLEWMATLREVLKLDAKTYVPGHGRIGARQDVEKFLGYLEDLKALVSPAVKRGDSLEQVVNDSRLPAKYAAFGFQNFFPANLQKMYAQLKAAQPAAAPQRGARKKGERP